MAESKGKNARDSSPPSTRLKTKGRGRKRGGGRKEVGDLKRRKSAGNARW